MLQLDWRVVFQRKIGMSLIARALVPIQIQPNSLIRLFYSTAPTSKPTTPSPTPTWLDTAPAVGKEVLETAVSEEVEVEVEVTTGPGPVLVGLDAVLPPGGGEPAPLGLFEDGGDAGGGMIVVAVAAEVAVVGGGDPVTDPVDAVLLVLSLSVHKVVVSVPTAVVSELDDAEPEDVETVTLWVNVAAVVVAEDEVAV